MANRRQGRPNVPLAFYCVVDSTYFPGAVALINSLRLQGHAEPIVALDCGLTEPQRRLLEEQALLIDPPQHEAPYLLKWFAPVAWPADVMLLVDADMIAARSLSPIVDAARSGKIAAVADALPERFDERWRTTLGLGTMHRRVYVNSGLIGLPAGRGTSLLHRLRECADHVDIERSLFRNGVPTDPFYFADQDILNALLSSEYEAEDVYLIDQRLAPHPPFNDLELVDEATVTCRYPDGSEPFVLHHVLAKPWLARLAPNLYSRLLARLWFAEDVALPLPLNEAPLRLRLGTVPELARRWNAGRLAWTTTRRRLGLRRRSLAARLEA